MSADQGGLYSVALPRYTATTKGERNDAISVFVVRRGGGAAGPRAGAEAARLTLYPACNVCPATVLFDDVFFGPATDLTPTATPTAATAAVPGDLNGDAKVDILDFSVFAGNFGKAGASVPGDFN